MILNFYTENIDKKLYKRAIQCILYDTLKKSDNRWLLIDNLTISIYPSNISSQDPNFHGKNGVGGVTGINTIKMYLNDESTSRKDTLQRALRVNLLAISHELAHHILITLGMTHRVKLRNNDYSGHKKGATLNFSTAEVHDRHIEGKFKTLTFWHLWIPPVRFTIQYLDIGDLL